MPTLTGNLGTAPYEALEPLGRAIAEGGGVIGAAAIKEREAQTLVQVHNADTAMENASTEFEAQLDPANPQAWLPALKDHLTVTRDEILSREDLTPEAKSRIHLRLDRFESQSRAETQGKARVATHAQAAGAIESGLRVAMQRQDRTRFDGELEAGIKGGYLFPWHREEYNLRFAAEGDSQKKAAAVAQFDSAQNGVTSIATAYGEEQAYKELDAGTFGDLDAVSQEKLRRVAREVAGQRTFEQMNLLADGIATGAVKSDADINDFEGPHTPPRVIEKARIDLRQHDVQAEAIDRRENGVASSVELFERIKDLKKSGDIKKDALTFYTTLAEIKKRVNEDSDGTLTKLLSEKMWSAPVKFTPDELVMKNLHETLGNNFDPVTGVIPWKIQVPVYELDRSGKPKTRGGKPIPVKDEHGHIKTETKIDPAARARSIDAQTKVLQKLRDHAEANPGEFRDLEKAKKKLNEFLPEGTRAGILDMLQKQMDERRAAKPQASRGALDEDLISTVKGLEGFTPAPQHDFRQTSIGYGTRAKRGETAISQSEADARLREELSMHAANVDEAAQKIGATLTKGQRNALISFDFNTGRAAYLLESSGGDLGEIKQRLALYTKAGGRDLPGLVSRRKVEAAIFES